MQRSVSPSKFESQATGSPTKLSVPNRKIRNQPSNRVHDIEFAAEISTSLIAQVRNLQALLAEREEELKDIKYDKSTLEIESEGFQQRVRALDESEHRYKEENWNLETRLQELSTQQKEAADREKKLTQALNLSKAEKVAAQKELDEVKLSHSKLTEEHSAAIKHHDIELGTAKRNMAMAEGEREAMQRKIDDLSSQNQELAKAFSTQRGRILDREPAVGTSDEDRDSANDRVTPEHSPPPSPVKGTPRHSMLETETLKSSLHHAQRTIQSQRSLLHREKTEKLELKRLVQDLRDDLEKARTESSGNSSSRRSRKAEAKEARKTPRLLGSFRSSRQEVVQDDPDWEDQQDLSPRASITPSPAIRQAGDYSLPTEPSDHFDTANEGGESAFETAFETANERGTETEEFETVNEEFSGSEDAETETEGTSRGFGKMKQTPRLPAGLARYSSRESYHSTASTSADEDDFPMLRTPTGTFSSQRSSRYRPGRHLFSRSSRQPSEEPNLRSSPASFASSTAGTPQPGGQSLYAELQDFDGSEEESVGGMTPSRRSIRSMTPGSFSRPMSPPPAVPPLPKVIMVDSGVMTDPVRFAPNLRHINTSAMVDSGTGTDAQEDSLPGSPISVIAGGRPMSMDSVIGPSGNRALWPNIHEDDYDSSRPLSAVYSDAGAQHDPDMEEKLAQFPAPPGMLHPILPPPPTLSLSQIASEDIEPQEEITVTPTLSITSIWNESLEPQAEPETPPPELSMSSILAENLEPLAEPEIPPPELGFSSIVIEDLEPVAEPETPPPALSLSTIVAENLEPLAEPEILPPPLSMSTILAENLEPVAEPEIPPPKLDFSGIFAENLEPRAEPEVPLPALTLTSILAEDLEPVAEPEIPPPALTLSTILAENLEPRAEPEVPPPALSLSSILAEGLVPIAEPEIPPPDLTLSTILVEHLEPVAEPETPLPELTLTTLLTETVEPIAEPEVPAPSLSVSHILSEALEPIAEPEIVIPPPTLTMSAISREHVEPLSPVAPTLSMSAISGEHVEPLTPVAPTLSLSTIAGEHVEPVAPEMPQLVLSTISTEHVEPVAEPEAVIPAPIPIIPILPELSMSTITGEYIEPIAEPEPVVPEPPRLSLSTLATEDVQPISEPEPEVPKAPELTLTTILGEEVEPIAEPLPELSVSSIVGEHVEPVAVVPPTLSLSTISREAVEPIAEPEPKVPELSISSILGEHVEPISEPEPEVPELSISSIVREHVEPIAAMPPALSLSTISREEVEPIAEPEPKVPELSISSILGEHVEPIAEPEPEIPQLTVSSIVGEHVEPIAAEPPKLAMSSISTEAVVPVSEPEIAVLPPSLNLSSIRAEHWEPREDPPVVPSPIAWAYSNLSMQQVHPISEPEVLPPYLALSPIAFENVIPVLKPPPILGLSSIAAEGVEPISPVQEKPYVPEFRFSSIESVETKPVSPRSPRRDGFILPRNMESPFVERSMFETPGNKLYGSSRGRGRDRDYSTFIAEDETRQSPSDTPEFETPESQRPFRELSTNLNSRPARKPPVSTTDQECQTYLTADAIEEMFKARSRPGFFFDRSDSVGSIGSPGTTGTTGTVRIRRSHDNFGSPIRNKSKMVDDTGNDTGSIRRPRSSTSTRTSIQDAPPLPSNHRQVIEAARSDSAHGSQTNMGPPLWPASALKRPTTPGQGRPITPMSTRGTPTPRAARPAYDNLEVQSPHKLTARSRQSSVSSFASEIDTRFNMRPGDMGIDPRGFGPNTDPRMIQAITQTMIGEYLWKYTRKTGRGEMSGNRHRRYFWVHPYTRTLYWSERDPSTAGRAELRAKSVPIEAVRVVTDDNPMPPGLHRKSLVVVAPGRTIKFTCTTGQRHETWFNALSYLLLRTNTEGQSDAEEMAGGITQEDVDEFNPQFGRPPPNGTRPRAPPSLSSYNSRTTRNESPAVGMSMNIPTLTPTPQKAHTMHRPSLGTLTKIGGYLKSGSTFSSRRGRVTGGHDNNIYEASEVHDSAEDLREIIERQDRESDRLENVRACCDGEILPTDYPVLVANTYLGKHDVGTLHHTFRRGRSNNHSHSHPASTSNTMGSLRSRV